MSLSSIAGYRLSSAALETLRSALRSVADVTAVTVPGEVFSSTLRRELGAIVVELSADSQALGVNRFVAEVVRRCPHVPVIAYCDVTRGGTGQIVQFCRSGGSDLVLTPYENVRDCVLRALAGSARRRRAGEIAAEIQSIAGPEVAKVMLPLLHQVGAHLSVQTAAAATGVSVRTLGNRARELNLPAPKVLVAWARVLVAARMLAEDRPRRVRDIANAVGLTEEGLRLTVSRLASVSVQQLRDVDIGALVRRIAPGVASPPRPTAGSKTLPSDWVTL